MALTVGLTGGIASGKSAASSIFIELGARLIDADSVARSLVAPDSSLLQEIVDTFGREILVEGGGLDRRKLGDIVFNDKAKRRTLEGILHPAIAEETDGRIAVLKKVHPEGVIIVDAALMIEAGRHKRYEKLVVVHVDEKTQIERLVERDGLSVEAAEERIATQMPLDEKRGYADYVIDNSGAPEELRRQVEEVYKRLKALSGTSAAGDDAQ